MRQYNDCVVGPGSPRYDEAYFDVNYVRTYTTSSAVPSATGTSTSTPTSSASTSVSVPQTTGSSGGVGARENLISLTLVLWLSVGTVLLV